MNKFIKYLLIFLIVDILILGAYFGLKGLNSGGRTPASDDYEWVEMDSYYTPKNFIEGFLRDDAESRSLLPISIRNFGENTKVLKTFLGKNFAGPKEVELKMMFPGMEEWILVEIKYKDEKKREIQRANLYVLIKEEWRLADTGSLTR
ncbi:MAG: hypothetical protein KKD59_06090 [Acidobacteria bacterium]|nr:hypothetical protein [Acidobacteriota bacterium]MBU4495245.1 hypothetical protein [Acidobacteriota bacterium]